MSRSSLPEGAVAPVNTTFSPRYASVHGFSLRSGLSGVWRLQGAPTPTGPWTPFSVATLTTNGPGRYRFLLVPETASVFLRVAVE